MYHIKQSVMTYRVYPSRSKSMVNLCQRKHQWNCGLLFQVTKATGRNCNCFSGTLLSCPGGRLNINMLSYEYRDPHFKDKTDLLLSYPPYLGKTVFILRRGPGMMWSWTTICPWKYANGLYYYFVSLWYVTGWFHPYSSGLLHWQSWRIWVNGSYKSTKNDDITITNENLTKLYSKWTILCIHLYVYVHHTTSLMSCTVYPRRYKIMAGLHCGKHQRNCIVVCCSKS